MSTRSRRGDRLGACDFEPPVHRSWYIAAYMASRPRGNLVRSFTVCLSLLGFIFTLLRIQSTDFGRVNNNNSNGHHS